MFDCYYDSNHSQNIQHFTVTTKTCHIQFPVYSHLAMLKYTVYVVLNTGNETKAIKAPEDI